MLGCILWKYVCIVKKNSINFKKSQKINSLTFKKLFFVYFPRKSFEQNGYFNFFKL